ncbi:MAG TPA: copper resistance CopC family protein [Stellaceae bacterium]|nr:copper resistance CopC family protein [Stellaceae bacterium]
MKHALVVIVLALAAVAGAAPADAHAFLDRAEPAVGSTVVSAPAAVRIWFTEALEPAFSTIAVTDAQGHAVGTGKATLDPKDPMLLVLALPPLPPGTYRVAWRVVSVDTHPTEGDFAFTVKTP